MEREKEREGGREGGGGGEGVFLKFALFIHDQ